MVVILEKLYSTCTVHWVVHIISLHTVNFSIVALSYMIFNIKYPIFTESSYINVYALSYIYFLQLDSGEIFCKPNYPVNFKVVGIKEEQMVNISLRYMDTMLEDSPVVACAQHRLRGEDTSQHALFQHQPQELLKYKYPSDFSLFSTMKTCDYKCINEHPTVVIQAQDIDQKDNSMMFNLVFTCLNSCHKTRGKQMYLLMKLSDSQGLVELLHSSLVLIPSLSMF